MDRIQVSDARNATIVKLTVGAHSEECAPADAMERAGALHAAHGAFPAFTYFAAAPAPALSPTIAVAGPTSVQGAPPADDSLDSDACEPCPPTAPTGAALGVSSFGAGNQIMDAAAAARMGRIYDRLERAGVTGIERTTTVAGYAPGTRMASIGYANQEARRTEFLAMAPAETAIANLKARIVAERRSDVVIGSREFADKIASNGKIRIDGLRIGEQAIRGLCGRIESPAMSYLLGLRDRIAREYAKVDDKGARYGDMRALHADTAVLADTIRHECRRLPEVSLKMRTRAEANPSRPSGGDVYAIVSPRYAPADLPEVADTVLPQLPRGARATFSYDPRSTAWTVRLNVWTPTAVADQAVGEPFQGFVSLGGRDNGTGPLETGGGIVILACLNAGVYTANGVDMSRRHMGRIMIDVAAMVEKARASIDVLCDAWGSARAQEIEVPSGVSIEDAYPGFWRHLLSDRSSELARVALPGRKETHVANLTLAYQAERRDESRVVRADLAQGWTRYAQAFAPEVQREAEQAIGSWMVSARKVGCTVKAPKEA